MPDLDNSYLEALVESMENLNDGQAFTEEGKPSANIVEQLNELYLKADNWEKDPEILRKAIQLALIKGMKSTHLQANHQITPDSIGAFIAFLIELVVLPQLKTDCVRIIDLAAGTGNLLFTVNNYLASRKEIRLNLVGIDNDELLLALASASSALQDTPVQWFYQDALAPILIEPAHIAISDLPVGYYPSTENVREFELSFKEELSYTHFLMVEQHVKYLENGGFGLFLLPANTFEGEKGKELLTFIQRSGDLLAMIHLPESFFADTDKVKVVILMCRDIEKDLNRPSPKVFVGQAPSFKQGDQMKHFIQKIVQWNQQFNEKGE